MTRHTCDEQTRSAARRRAEVARGWLELRRSPKVKALLLVATACLMGVLIGLPQILIFPVPSDGPHVVNKYYIGTPEYEQNIEKWRRDELGAPGFWVMPLALLGVLVTFGVVACVKHGSSLRGDLATRIRARKKGGEEFLFTAFQWKALADRIESRGALPLRDINGNTYRFCQGYIIPAEQVAGLAKGLKRGP